MDACRGVNHRSLPPGSHAQCIRLLAAAGTDVNATAKVRATTADMPRKPVSSNTSSFPRLPRRSPQDGTFPLYVAALEGAPADVIDALIELGASPYRKRVVAPAAGCGDLTAAHAAAQRGNAAALRALLRHGPALARAETTGAQRRTPLHYATDSQLNSSATLEAGLFECAEALLACGADPSAVSGNGSTPLHQASRGKSSRMACLLLAAGARTDAIAHVSIFPGGGFVRGTPLHAAATSSATPIDVACARALLEGGADPAATTAAANDSQVRSEGGHLTAQGPSDFVSCARQYCI